MKRMIITACAVFAFSAAALAQSNTAVTATDATPVVNAADHNSSAKSCTPEEMKSCGSGAKAENSKAKASGSSCCASKGSASASASASAADTKGGSCESASFGMGAQAPKKDE